MQGNHQTDKENQTNMRAQPCVHLSLLSQRIGYICGPLCRISNILSIGRRLADHQYVIQLALYTFTELAGGRCPIFALLRCYTLLCAGTPAAAGRATVAAATSTTTATPSSTTTRSTAIGQPTPASPHHCIAKQQI